MSVVVTVLSYQRPKALAATLESFVRQNAGLLGPAGPLRMIALDQASTGATREVLERHRPWIDRVYTTRENHGIGWGYAQLAALADEHGATHLLHLEDDWRCDAPLAPHLQPALTLLTSGVGQVRLRAASDRVAAANHATGEALRTERRGAFAVGNHHYVFNPHLAPLWVARRLGPLASEHHAQLRYQALGLSAAQLQAEMFVHMGAQRAPARRSRVPEPVPVHLGVAAPDGPGFAVALPTVAGP